MASLTAKVTCRKCGKEFEKEFYDSGSGAYKRLESKVEWAERSGSFLCSDCYKVEKREKDKAMGLVAEIKLGLFAPDEISIVFKGDTYPHKDKLKALGCRWTDEYPSDLFGMTRPPKAWVYTTDVDKAEEALDVIIKSEANFELPDTLETTLFQEFRKRLSEKKQKRSAEWEEALSN